MNTQSNAPARLALSAAILLTTASASAQTAPLPAFVPYAPPAYGPPPIQGASPWTFGATPAAEPPLRIDYEPGDAVPRGYAPTTTPRWNLVKAGAATTLTLWGLSMIVGSTLDVDRSAPHDAGSRTWAPMFVPVVGPWIAIETGGARDTAAAALVVDGIAQAFGLALVAAGFAMPKRELVRKPALVVEPTLGAATSGLRLRGTF